MKERKNCHWLKIALLVIAVALIGAVALIFFKQWEYAASEDYYSGLRTALLDAGRKCRI